MGGGRADGLVTAAGRGDSIVPDRSSGCAGGVGCRRSSRLSVTVITVPSVLGASVYRFGANASTPPDFRLPSRAVDLFRTIRCRVAIQAEQLADAARDLLPWGVTHAPTYRLEVEQGAPALFAPAPARGG